MVMQGKSPPEKPQTEMSQTLIPVKSTARVHESEVTTALEGPTVGRHKQTPKHLSESDRNKRTSLAFMQIKRASWGEQAGSYIEHSLWEQG